MLRERPDPNFVEERPSLYARINVAQYPPQAPPPIPPRGGSPPGLETGITLSPVVVRLAPPPPWLGSVPIFRPKLEIITQSRTGLAAYRAANEREMGTFHYPLRVRIARATRLPFALNGLLATELTGLETLSKTCSDWLFDNARSLPLFGLNRSEAQSQLEYQESICFCPLGAIASGHAVFQQWYSNPGGQGRWPVLGGQVVVHARVGTRLASATSAFFSIPSDRVFASAKTREEAVASAQQALAGYLAEDDELGFCADLLRPYRYRPPAEWPQFHLGAAGKLLRAIALPTQPDLRLPDTKAELVELLGRTWEERALSKLPQWNAKIAPYAGSDLFILPFDGDYYLAYRVEVSCPPANQYWRVFIDASTGDVLGQPESIVAHNVTVFQTSHDARENPPSTDTTVAMVDLNNTLDPLMKWNRWTSSGDVPFVLTAISGTATAGLEFEAANIAYHAKKLIDHFVTLTGQTPDKLPGFSPVQITVGMQNDRLDPKMGFDPVEPPCLRFQTDNAGGLPTSCDDGVPRKVHAPSLDPEVIYHEFAHWLMWCINHAPFDQPRATVPFGPALVEGYANYLARSLAAPSGTGSDLWACAAYRESDGADPNDRGWGQRWSLKSGGGATADALPMPNMYPDQRTDGLPVYDVGMILARALRDIPQSNPDQANLLALEALTHVRGCVSSFELVAEGLIDQARQAGLSDTQIEAVEDAFANHNILAERGVQSLAVREASNGQTRRLLAGSDAGVFTYKEAGTPTWETWDWPPAGNSARSASIVGLAVHGNTGHVYAATEDGVYRRDSDASAWTELAGWPADRVPICLLVADDTPYVGTDLGVWHHSGGAWKPWGEDDQEQLKALALQMADVTLMTPQGVKLYIRYAASVVGVSAREDDGTHRMWANPPQIANALVTALAARDGSVYAGTLKDGIWSQSPVRTDNPPTTNWGTWTRLDKNGAFSGKPIVCLAAQSDGLYVGTTAGLSIGTLSQGAWQWREEPQLFDKAVTRVLPMGEQGMLVGTALDGLLFSKPTAISGSFTWESSKIGT